MDVLIAAGAALLHLPARDVPTIHPNLRVVVDPDGDCQVAPIRVEAEVATQQDVILGLRIHNQAGAIL